MRKIILLAACVLVFVSLAGCAPGPNELKNIPNNEEKVAGFWSGLWHGIISPVTFIISLFNKSVSVYEVHNNGGWYNFGFLLGVSALSGGSGGGAAAARKS